MFQQASATKGGSRIVHAQTGRRVAVLIRITDRIAQANKIFVPEIRFESDAMAKPEGRKSSSAFRPSVLAFASLDLITSGCQSPLRQRISTHADCAGIITEAQMVHGSRRNGITSPATSSSPPPLRRLPRAADKCRCLPGGRRHPCPPTAACGCRPAASRQTVSQLRGPAHRKCG